MRTCETSSTTEERRGGTGNWLGGRLSCLRVRHLHHTEVLLRDEMALHPQSELITAGSGEDQRRNIDAEVGNLQAIQDVDVGKRGAAYELVVVETDEIDVEVVRAFGVRQAKIQSHVLVLERKHGGLKVREDADQAFLLRQTVLDHLIADQEGLDTGLDDVGHEESL